MVFQYVIWQMRDYIKKEIVTSCINLANFNNSEIDLLLGKFESLQQKTRLIHYVQKYQ